jgi:hypothetical protein
MAAPDTADEPLWPQANLQNIHMEAAWDLPVPPAASSDPPAEPNGGKNVVYVCLIDNGVQLAHGELAPIAEHLGWNPITDTAANAPLALAGEGAHATACAGIIAAGWANATGIGVVGIARNVRLHSVVVPQPMSGPNLVLAITEARTRVLPNNGAGHRRVILICGRLNIAAADQAAVQAAIVAAIAADIAVVLATGDADAATLSFPASLELPGLVVVGAVTPGTGALRVSGAATGPGTAPVGASWGSSYDPAGQFVVAPGTAVRTTDLTAANGYNTSAANPNYVQTFGGTGAAATHAAGVAALLLSHNARLTADDVRCLLYRTAEKISSYTFAANAAHPDGNWHDQAGYGRIDAQQAVLAARTSKAQVTVTLGGSGTTVNLPGVPYRRTAVATIRLRHNNSRLTSSVKYTLPALPASFAWAASTPANPIEVVSTAAGGAGFVDVTLEYTAPSATGTNGGTIAIATDDLWTPSVNVVLNASSVPPPIVDTVLVLDRSGSMSATTVAGVQRWEAVTAAADLFITLLEDEDQLGIVRFDNRWDVSTGDRLIAMTLAGPMGSRTALRNALTAGSPLAPSGSTSIAGGMKLGMSVLEALSNPSGRRRAMLVMTDGHHNTSPDYPSAYADINAAAQGVPRVFALGVGLDTVDAEFDAIVSVTKGYTYQTGTVITDTEIQELFTKVLSNVADADFADDPLLVLQPGQSGGTQVVVGDTDFQVDFILLFGSKPPAARKYADIALEAPSGAQFAVSDIIAGSVPNMKGESRPGHVVLRVLLPAFAAKPRDHIGTWKVTVKNGSKAGNELAASNGREPGTFSCSIMSMVKSDLRLRGHLVHGTRDPGEPFGIVVEPTLYGAPVKLNGAPDAHVTRPDGTTRIVSLAANAAGQYVGQLTDTGLGGLYSVDVEAQVTTPAGINLKRFLRLQTRVVVPGQGGLGSDGETPEGGSRPDQGRPGLWCRFWCRFFCLDCRGRRRCC